MNSAMISLGIASIIMCIGMFFRTKIKILRKMLVPVSVVAGIFGFIFMNFIQEFTHIDIDTSDFTNIVNVLFTISFISIGLSSSTSDKKGKSNKDNMASVKGKGSLGMGLIWCIAYSLTAIAGVIIIWIVGGRFNMNPMYGILIPFAFCQGPGQASTYGRIFEQTYGYENAEMVALVFAIIGFLVAFVVGVPLAKYGLKKGISKSKSKISESIENGYFSKEEQRESIGKVTTYSGNIETLTIHFAIIGVCYIITLIFSKLISTVPLLGPTFSEMLFFWGMISGYLVKFIMVKFKIEHLINIQLQGRITGWTSDYLVVCAFMAIHINTLGKWIIPILIECIVCTALVFLICVYFGERLGSDYDFERILGLYGTCTGTTPSGIALLRIVDPKLKTSTPEELGMMNIVSICSTPTMIFITLAGLQTISLFTAIIGISLCVVMYILFMKIFRVWNKPTFTLKRGIILGEKEVQDTEIRNFIQGALREEQ